MRATLLLLLYSYCCYCYCYYTVTAVAVTTLLLLLLLVPCYCCYCYYTVYRCCCYYTVTAVTVTTLLLLSLCVNADRTSLPPPPPLPPPLSLFCHQHLHHSCRSGRHAAAGGDPAGADPRPDADPAAAVRPGPLGPRLPPGVPHPAADRRGRGADSAGHPPVGQGPHPGPQ